MKTEQWTFTVVHSHAFSKYIYFAFSQINSRFVAYSKLFLLVRNNIARDLRTVDHRQHIAQLSWCCDSGNSLLELSVE